MDDPGGTTNMTTPCATRTTVRASDRFPISARTMARSALPADNSLAASETVPTVVNLRRTEEPDFVSCVAIADTIWPAFVSEPAATVRVTGWVKYRYPNRPAATAT